MSFSYFGYNKEKHEAVYEYESLASLNVEEMQVYDNIYLYPKALIEFNYEDLSEIYLNGSSTFEKRQKKPNSNYEWDENSGQWVPNFADLKAAKKIEIDQACANHIVAGFLCQTSLGEFTYPTKQNDQMNMASSILDSLISNDPNWVTYFWCMDASGTWDFRPHTAEQMQEVGRKAKAHVMNQMMKNSLLQNQIDAIDNNATDAMEVLEQIYW